MAESCLHQVIQLVSPAAMIDLAQSFKTTTFSVMLSSTRKNVRVP